MKLLKIIYIEINDLINRIVYFPHILVYKRSFNKPAIKCDIQINSEYLKIYSHSENAKLIELLKNDRYFRSLFYFRIGRKSAKLISWLSKGDYSFTIAAELGPGCYVAHPFSTVVYAKTIGSNFVIHQNTTIGIKQDGENDKRPVIGDNVNVGANVCIIGGITIGDNVIIGAGSVVVKDIPSNSVVVGNPARIIKQINSIES